MAIHALSESAYGRNFEIKQSCKATSRMGCYDSCELSEEISLAISWLNKSWVNEPFVAQDQKVMLLIYCLLTRHWRHD